MIQLHPQFIKKNGRKEFVAIPYDEFVAVQEILEDFEDLVKLRRAREEQAKMPTIPLAEVKKRLGM